NFEAGQTKATGAVVASDANGDVCIFTSAQTDIIVDQFGERPSSSGYGVHAPQRFVDTRQVQDGEDAGTPRPRLSAGVHPWTWEAMVDDSGQLIREGETVLFNLTAVDPQDAGFLTAFPCGAQPDGGPGGSLTSNVNFAAGETASNFVVTTAGANGQVCVY